MAIPRYNPSEVRLQTGAGIAEQAQAQTWQNLSNKLNQWSGVLYQEGAAVREQEGKRDAEQTFLSEGKNAKITEDYTIHGQSYNNSLKALLAKQVSLDTNNSLQKYFEANIESEAGFTNQAEAYYKRAMSEMPEYLRAEYSIDFEAKKANYLSKVRSNEKKKNDDIKLATGNDFHKQQYSLATQASREGSNTLAMVEAEKAEANLQDLKDARLISAVEYGKQVDILYKGVADAKYQGENERLIEADDIQGSQKYINDFRKTTNTLYTDEERETLADEMQRSLNGRIMEIKAAKKDGEDFSNQIVGDAIDVLKSGKGLINESQVNDALQNASVAKKWEYVKQKKASSIYTKYSDLSLPEMETKLNELKAQKEMSAVEVEVMNTLEQNLKEKSTLAKNDPMTLGEQEGAYTTVPIQIGDIDTLQAELGKRAKNSNYNKVAFGDSANFLLKEQEAAQLSGWLESADTPVDDKLNWIETVNQSAGSKANTVFQQLNKKGAATFSMAANLINEGKKETARNILKGQVILREFGNVEGITQLKFKLYGKLGNAMIYAGQGDREMLKQSALALYMQKAEANGRLEKGLTGGGENEVITELTNGIMSHNGQDFFLPKNVSKGDMEDWIDELNPAMFTNVQGVTPEQAVEIAQRGQLISAGNNRYRVKFKNNWLTDKSGKPFELRY